MRPLRMLSLFLFASLLLIAPAYAQDEDSAAADEPARRAVTAEGAELRQLADGFSFTEGPATDDHGNVYFTDQPNDRIHRWSVDGELSTFLEPSGRSNGLYFAPDGRLLACADANNELWAIDIETGQHEVLVRDYQGKRLDGPNDLWVHGDGTVYFTDPFYKRPYWAHEESEQDAEAVYRLSADGEELIRVDDQLVKPNGIIGDAQRDLLLVADIRDRKTYAYRITDDHRLADRRLFCEQGSDGMTIDVEGNVYLTGTEGVTVYDREGNQIEVISVPQRWTANVTFAGPQRRTLFITAGPAVYAIEMRVQGLR